MNELLLARELAKETNGYTLADAMLLNQLKNLIRGVTRAVDALPVKVYPDTIEAKQVKHELSVLVAELGVHGLLPVEVVTEYYVEPAELSFHGGSGFCYDPTCPCKEDADNIQAVAAAVDAGLVTRQEADNIYQGKTV